VFSTVVKLVQTIFRDGKVPIAFRHATVVLIPKEAEGQYRGVALLEAAQKTRVGHYQRANSGSCDKLGQRKELRHGHYMQLAEVEGRIYNQIFLDLSKAYDTVHRPRLFEILVAYGVGSQLMKVLKDSWTDSVAVPRLAKCYDKQVPTARGVKQGDVTSPLFST
jgi:hypothetical protein